MEKSERSRLIRWLDSRIEEEGDRAIWQRGLGSYNTASIHVGRRDAFSLVKTVLEGFDEV